MTADQFSGIAFGLLTLALATLILVDIYAPKNAIVETIRGWQSGIAILFGFLALIYSNQLQFRNNARIELMKLTTDVVAIASSLKIDVIARQRELQGLTIYETMLDAMSKALRPNNGWAANVTARDVFCQAVQKHYVGRQAPDFGIQAKLAGDVGKLSRRISEQYLRFVREYSDLNALLAKSSLAECRSNPDGWKQVYPERIGQLIAEADEVKKSLDEEVDAVTRQSARLFK